MQSTKKVNGAKAPTKPAKGKKPTPPAKGPVTALNDSIKSAFARELADAKGKDPKGGPTTITGGPTIEERKALADKVAAAAGGPALAPTSREQLIANAATAPTPPKMSTPYGKVIPGTPGANAAMKALPPPKPTKAEPLGPVEQLVVSISELKAALTIASKEDVRKSLEGVCLRERDGRIELASSNGHCMLVQRIAGVAKGSPVWAKGKGIVIARERLVALCKMGEGEAVLHYGTGHPHVLADVGFATFKLLVEDTPFPAYENILASNSDALAGGEGLPMTSVCIAPEYVKAATAVAKCFESEELHCFPSTSAKAATMITFGAQVPAVLYVMPKTGGEAMASTTLAMIGPGLKGTVAALRAHITRTQQAEKGATKEAKVQLAEKRAALEKRLAGVIEAAGKALEHRPAPGR
jgi:hypothetical protein